jgi:hypothetical protein
MSRRVFFYCNIEIDFLILASIAKLIRNNYTNYELVFIESNHPRISGGKMKEFYHYFDRVISLKYYSIPSLILKIPSSSLNIIKFKKQLKQINGCEKDVLFTFDVFKYTDLLVFDYFKKQRVKTVIVSAFLGKRFLKKNLKILWLPTLINCYYNVISRAFYLYTESKINNTSLKGYKHFSGSPNHVITIETSSSIVNPKNKRFKNLKFPISVLSNNQTDKGDINKLLLMVSSLHSSRYPGYWQTINNIIDNLPTNFDIYIKDHPQAKSEAPKELKRKKLKFLNSKSVLELEVLKHNIASVCGVGSTGLITTSWMGLNVFDLTCIMNYPEKIKTYFNEYLEMAPNISKINSIEDINNIGFKMNDINYFDNSEWNNCLTEVFNYE